LTAPEAHLAATKATADGPGVEFTETMRGFGSARVSDEYRAARDQGERDGKKLEFTVTVRSTNLDRMIEDRAHEADLFGTATVALLSPEPMKIENGRFQLLVRDADRPGARKMVYQMPMVAADGRRFHMEGYKSVKDDKGPDLWSDTTTLYVTVREGGADGTMVVKGMVHILMADFAKQLRTMKAVGARNKFEELKTLARFGRFFMGALNEVYGGVFASPSALNPDAPPREHRPLRCGPAEIHEFDTKDGVRLRLTRFQGGTKGPVILSPGFGTSALAYTIDTTETNLPEFLYEAGYDVWVLDYRASPALPSASTQFTLDDVAVYDYPAAVETVLAKSGADSLQIMAHCVGSVTMLMSLASGLQGVRSAVASQLTLHPRTAPLNTLRADVFAGNLLTSLGVDTLTTDIDGERGWAEKLYDQALRLYPAGRERCSSPVCRRILFMYGEVFDHDQINDATHEAIHEMFGVANLKTLTQITRWVRAGHVVSADGDDVYLPQSQRLKIPIAFLHGEHNKLFLPEGSELTCDHLRSVNGPDLYTRHVFENYAHMDCFIGKDAARDVYPTVRAELDRHNPA
jgi:choline dehydrogenase-like flavoprotein